MQIIKIKDKEVLLDDEDYEWIMDLKNWRFASNNYLSLSTRKKHQGMAIYMHRIIMLAEYGYDKLWDRDYQVDHIDRNPLNNQKSNLRIVTASENCINRDNLVYFKKSINEFRGVITQIDNRRKNPYTYIKAKCKGKHLGSFKTKELAAKAWDIEALRVYGDNIKPYLNFPL